MFTNPYKARDAEKGRADKAEAQLTQALVDLAALEFEKSGLDSRIKHLDHACHLAIARAQKAESERDRYNALRIEAATDTIKATKRAEAAEAELAKYRRGLSLGTKASAEKRKAKPNTVPTSVAAAAETGGLAVAA